MPLMPRMRPEIVGNNAGYSRGTLRTEGWWLAPVLDTRPHDHCTQQGHEQPALPPASPPVAPRVRLRAKTLPEQLCAFAPMSMSLFSTLRQAKPLLSAPRWSMAALCRFASTGTVKWCAPRRGAVTGRSRTQYFSERTTGIGRGGCSHQSPPPAMRARRFDAKKGFGFIIPVRGRPSKRHPARAPGPRADLTTRAVQT